MTYIAAEVALAFNTANERKTWSARPNARDGVELVHFTAPANLVTLVLDCNEERFEVRFNKFHATWGDYVRAISHALYVVLSTLKQSGLPFDAPDDADGMEIIATSAPNSVTYVRWPDQKPPQFEPAPFSEFAALLGHTDTVEAATMPEIREPAGTIGGAEITGDDDGN